MNSPQTTPLPICPVCQEEIEDGDGSCFGEVLAHIWCMSEDEDDAE